MSRTNSSRREGSVYIDLNSSWYGRIEYGTSQFVLEKISRNLSSPKFEAKGSFTPGNLYGVLQDDIDRELTDHLIKFAKDPVAIVKKYGQQTKTCCLCNKPLSTEKDANIGYHFTCANRFLLPWD